MASRQDAAGTSTYEYDTAGRLSEVNDASAGQKATFAYNTLSQLDTITYGTSGNRRKFGYNTLGQLTGDSLLKPAPDNTALASISYGYDANGNETSKTTIGFAGSASNTYIYDFANRLTSWQQGSSTPATYTYDKSGNRTAIGSRALVYNERNQLTSDGTATYTYTPRGTLSGTITGQGTVTTPSTFDAYEQQISQGSRTYAYDGLGRVISASGGITFQYTGLGNDLASDGTATYTRDPSGDLTGVKAGGNGVFAWTDLHDDVVGQFTATGTTVAGSRTYNPFGTMLANNNLIGNLGYQSGWTDPDTARVNMHARWYSPETTQFASRDTATVSPIPNSIRANRYAYGDGNPMTVTDPTGHWGCGWLCDKAKSVVNKVVNVAKSAYNWVADKVSNFVDNIKDELRGMRDWARQKFNQAKNWVVQKVNQVKDTVKNTYNYVKQKAQQAIQAAKQIAKHYADTVKKIASDAKKAVSDAYKATANWVKEHKAEIAGFVVGAIVGVGCGLAIGWTGVGAVACGALAGAVGSLVTGAMQGHTGWQLVGDGLIGGLTGALGGVVGAKVGGILGGMAAKAGAGLLTRIGLGAASGAIGGAVTGGVTGAAGYGMGCLAGHECTASGFGKSVRDGAVIGGLTGAIGGGFGGARAKTSCHSFDPKTRVKMADGTTKAIGKIAVGDKVLATDPVSKRSEAKPVTALHNNVDTDLSDVVVRNVNTGKTATLKTTQHHPFWDTSTRQWVDAADLKPNASALTGPDGQLATVVEVRNYVGETEMRDLTVDKVHTYYVLAGNTPLLVHNNNSKVCNITHPSRQDALDAAYDRADVPRGTAADAEWQVGNDRNLRGTPNYRYSEDAGSHGNYMQFETPGGSRVIAEHLNDPNRGPHFHAGQPKGDPSRNFVNFGWDLAAEAERYSQVGGKHHLDY